MPAIGHDTKVTYYESEISDSVKYGKMKAEALSDINDPDSVVVPVRASTPHFRALSTIRHVRVGSSEQDVTHDEAIKMLHKAFDAKRIRLVTYVFTNNVKTTQVIYDSKNAYKWWPDGQDNRISFSGGNYIQPDLCGRNQLVFAASRRQRALIVEVINTHIPEHKTLEYLVRLSLENHIVAFYYVSPNKKYSQFNAFKQSPEFVELRTAFYLFDGVFYKNDQSVIPQTNKLDIAWYQTVKSKYFDPAVAAKNQ